MHLMLLGAAVMILCGTASFLCKRTANGAIYPGMAGIITGSILGLAGCCQTLFLPETVNSLQVICCGNLPANLNFPRMSAVFTVPLLILAPACALHARDYIHERGWVFWGFFNLLTATIMLIPTVCFDSPAAFLLLWEIMGATSFALVCFEFKHRDTRSAAWLYILSAQAGALCLILMFILLNSPLAKSMPVVIFILAVLGFGLKCGLAMLHFWLPPAHAAAPAPVSALMSGAMNNMGIYGIFATGSLLLKSAPEGTAGTFGWILFAMGICGALGAIIFALAQTHLKRLIAYSSVENFGIMALGYGLFFLGIHWQNNTLAGLGLAAALLHMYNHSMLKGLLFLCAGAVHIGAGTYQMEKLGGLMKKMPLTGFAFLFGSAGISGIPPFNAFLSEFLLYAAAICGLSHAGSSNAMFFVSLAVIIVLALVGGVAAAAFSKASGIVFPGEPRSAEAADAHDVPRTTKTALVFLMICSIATGLCAPFFLRQYDIAPILMKINLLGTAMLITGMVLYLGRRPAKTAALDKTGPTWDCGYAAPAARMQYTGNSYALPLAKFFHALLGTEHHLRKPDGIFPGKSSESFTTTDFSERCLWRPVFRAVIKLSEKVHHLQSGYLHLYILFMVIAIICMLVWAFYGGAE